jgi:hypothetical protein
LRIFFIKKNAKYSNTPNTTHTGANGRSKLYDKNIATKLTIKARIMLFIIMKAGDFEIKRAIGLI